MLLIPIDVLRKREFLVRQFAREQQRTIIPQTPALVVNPAPEVNRIVVRAIGIHGASDLAFCAIKFDCGCGGGDVLVCRKIVENAALLALCAVQIVALRQRFCLRHSLLRSSLEG